MHILFECFFGFSAFTGVFAMNALTLGIATGVIALLLCLVIMHKHQLEKKELKEEKKTQTKILDNEDANATPEETQKLMGESPVVSDPPKVSQVPSTLFDKTAQQRTKPEENTINDNVQASMRV